MVMFRNKNIKIKDHPLSIQVQSLWDKYLPALGYDKDINVNELQWDELDYIFAKIDEAVESWFTGCSYPDKNLIQCWNYQARHTKKNFKLLEKRFNSN